MTKANLRCAAFFVTVGFTLLAMGVAIAGLCGRMTLGNECHYWTLLTLCVSIWVNPPKLAGKLSGDDPDPGPVPT